jgi:methylenetetrahydrofolate--tRNA-(uracil-5-)-methyltransferase
MLAGIFAGHSLLGSQPPHFSADTACGALAKYVSSYAGSDFQPMNITFGIMNPIDIKGSKNDKRLATSERALSEIGSILNGGN